MTLTPEKKKQLGAGLLFLVFAIVLYFQFFAGDSNQSASARVAQSGGSSRSANPKAVGSPVAQVSTREQPVITEPLPLALLKGRGSSDGGTGRNIFLFPTPTPVPTPKPPPPTPTPLPPPITLSLVNPAGVIARTADFNLTITGLQIPPDSKVYLSGKEYPTTFISQGQVSAAIPAAAISLSGNLRVEVKSASDPKLFSNSLNLNVADPPIPPFLYVALIVDKNGVHIAILKAQADGRLINVRVGDAIDKWKITGISGQKIDILDTGYNIPHALNFTGEGG